MTNDEVNTLAFETATTYSAHHCGDFAALVRLIEQAILIGAQRELIDLLPKGVTPIFRHPFTDTHATGVRTDGLCNLCHEPREHPAHQPGVPT